MTPPDTQRQLDENILKCACRLRIYLLCISWLPQHRGKASRLAVASLQSQSCKNEEQLSKHPDLWVVGDSLIWCAFSLPHKFKKLPRVNLLHTCYFKLTQTKICFNSEVNMLLIKIMISSSSLLHFEQKWIKLACKTI